MTDEKKVQDLIDAEYKRIALRDQFAAAALPACLQQIWRHWQVNKVQVVNVYATAAAAAYEAADAMMAERRITMFEAAEEQKPTTAVSPQGVSVYEALRQLVGYVEDMSGHAEVGRMLQPNSWANQPDHPMTLARTALEADRGKSVHHAGDADGWIEWHGNSIAFPVGYDAVVDVCYRNGNLEHMRRAVDLRWPHSLDGYQTDKDIMSYRVVRP